MTLPTWPALEGAATFVFLIAITWTAGEIPEMRPLLWTGLVLGGAGGVTVAIAYWQERLHETQTPVLHGVGTGLIAAGAVAFAVTGLA